MPEVTTRRELPDGYTDQHDSDLWNVGHVFLWSTVYEAWLDCGVRLSIKPNVSVRDAFEEHFDCPMWNDHAVFFDSEFC